MLPQQHRSDLEGWTPLVFENIKAYPSKLPKKINLMFRNFIKLRFKASKNNKGKEEVLALSMLGWYIFVRKRTYNEEHKPKIGNTINRQPYALEM